MDAFELPLPLLFRRDDNDPTANCTKVTPACPVDQTIYGYYPNKGANYFFLIVFAICLIANTYLGIRSRLWTFLIALFFGCFGEVLGYAGRIMLASNPWSENGFQIQISCLIIAPAFVAAGVYLTLKHIVIELGPQYSVLKPRLYTWIFIFCDILSLVMQGAGGGTAATADNGSSLQDVGKNLMLAGIVWQVVTLLVFGLLCGIYASRIHKNHAYLSASAQRLLAERRFRVFIWGMTLAYFTIFARCVYRIAELAKGWASNIMQDETGFIVLEGVMIVIAVLCLTILHPAVAFPEMAQHKVKGVSGVTEQEKRVDEESSPERR